MKLTGSTYYNWLDFLLYFYDNKEGKFLCLFLSDQEASSNTNQWVYKSMNIFFSLNNTTAERCPQKINADTNRLRKLHMVSKKRFYFALK